MSLVLAEPQIWADDAKQKNGEDRDAVVGERVQDHQPAELVAQVSDELADPDVASLIRATLAVRPFRVSECDPRQQVEEFLSCVLKDSFSAA
jgi:hypothetical protein